MITLRRMSGILLTEVSHYYPLLSVCQFFYKYYKLLIYIIFPMLQTFLAQHLFFFMTAQDTHKC